MSVLKYRDEQGNIHVVGESGSFGGSGSGSVTMEDLSSVTTVTPDPATFTGSVNNIKCYELGGMRFFQAAVLLYLASGASVTGNRIKIATLAITGKTIVNATLVIQANVSDSAGDHPAVAQILPSGSIFLVTEEPIQIPTSGSATVSLTGTWAVV